MSVKSFFESERRKKQIRGLLVILALCFVGTMISSHFFNSKKPAPVPQTTSSTQISMVPSKADYEQHQAIYNDRLLNLERESKEAKQREAKLQSDKKRLEDRIALLEKNAPRTNRPAEATPSEDGWPPSEILGKQPISKKTGFTSGNQPQGRHPRQQSDAPVSSPAPRLVINNFGSAPNASSNVLGSLPTKAKPETLSYLPTGTFAKARLLNGATAPTRGQGSGNPVPVLLELTDSAVMPNLYRSGIKRCFVTANATGELASERVLIRLDRLSCIDENGGAVDKKIQGYVSGEDGKTGLRARLVTKSGQAIANALFTGTLAGLGKAVSLASENQTTSITGTVSTTVTNPWKAGFGEGATHAMDRITDYYLKLASDMFPVLEVDSGRNVEIVISNGLSIERNTKP